MARFYTQRFCIKNTYLTVSGTSQSSRLRQDNWEMPWWASAHSTLPTSEVPCALNLMKSPTSSSGGLSAGSAHSQLTRFSTQTHPMPHTVFDDPQYTCPSMSLSDPFPLKCPLSSLSLQDTFKSLLRFPSLIGSRAAQGSQNQVLR